jgi:transposase
MLLGYLFGIPSERRLVQEIQVNLAYRWFLGMGLTEKVIDAVGLMTVKSIYRFLIILLSRPLPKG